MSREHLKELEDAGTLDIRKAHELLFPSWFSRRISALNTNNPGMVSKELFILASRSLATVRSYMACVVKGVKYVCKSRDVNRKTQNSGVYVCGVGSDPFLR